MKKTLLSIAFLIIIASLIGCGGRSSSSAPGGINPGIASVIQLLPLQYVAQTNSYLYFKAKVLDGNGTPLPNIYVTFTNLSPIGTITTSGVGGGAVGTLSSSTVVKTDSLGYATVKIFSSEAGFVTVLAEVNVGTGKVRDKKTVYFTSSDTNIYLLPSMTLDVDSVPGNGIYNETSDFDMFEDIYDDTVEVLATVYDRWGQPAAGELILWGADQFEAIALEPLNLTTNINGQAKAIIRDIPLSLRDAETFLNIYAYAPYVDGIGAFNMVTLFLQPVSIDTTLSYLTADPPVVETIEESTITAVIFMNTGEPIYDGATINFTTTCGTVTPFAQTTGGVAEATFTAPATEGTCTITATLRGTVIGTVDVLVTSELTVFPSTQAISGVTGGTATFTIFGGIPSYTVFTSNPLFPPVPSTVTASGDSFTVTVPAGTPTTSVTYTIRDSAGTTVTATLTITGVALSVTPASQTITAGAGCVIPAVNTASYTITGGAPSYSVYTNRPDITSFTAPTAGDSTTVTSSGGTFTIAYDVATTEDATVTITVQDSLGAIKTASFVIDCP